MDLAAMKRLARQPRYPRFFAAATLARVANDMFGVACVLLVLERTGSAELAGLVVASVAFPSVVTGPFVGAWLDLSGRRRAAMSVDRTIMAAVLLGIVAAAGHAPDWTLPLIGLCASVTYPMSFGGFTSLVPHMVEPDLLPEANALEASSFDTAIIAGPAIAGGIAALASPAAALIFGAALCVCSLVLVASIPELDKRAGRRGGRSHAAVVRSGLRQLATSPPLRSATAIGTIQLFGLGLLTVGFPFFALDVLGEEKHVAGFMWAAFAVGSSIGAIGLVRFTRERAPERVMLASVFALGAVMLLWPLAPGLAVALALIALAGSADGPGFAATFAVRQRFSPPEIFGQVTTTAASMKVGAFALGAAIAGPTVVALGAEGTLLLAASAQFVAFAAGGLLGGWLPSRVATEEAS